LKPPDISKGIEKGGHHEQEGKNLGDPNKRMNRPENNRIPKVYIRRGYGQKFTKAEWIRAQ